MYFDACLQGLERLSQDDQELCRTLPTLSAALTGRCGEHGRIAAGGAAMPAVIAGEAR
jgi:hypothetical protein